MLVNTKAFALVIFVQTGVKVADPFEGAETCPGTLCQIRCHARTFNIIGKRAVAVLYAIDERAVEDFATVLPKVHAGMVAKE